MMKNRSVPADLILPHIVYNDVGKAIEWLTRMFGFLEHYRYGDPANPQGAQMHLGNAYVMLSSARPGSVTPSQAGGMTQMVTIFVEDVDSQYA
ncbi:MAG TPA: hypothetical protein VGL72_27815, partial [Bryobacteraceae bacterium]